MGLYTGAWRDFLSLESGSARPGPPVSAVSVSAWCSLLLRAAAAARRAQCCSSPGRERCRRSLAPFRPAPSSPSPWPRVSERGPSANQHLALRPPRSVLLCNQDAISEGLGLRVVRGGPSSSCPHRHSVARRWVVCQRPGP